MGIFSYFRSLIEWCYALELSSCLDNFRAIICFVVVLVSFTRCHFSSCMLLSFSLSFPIRISIFILPAPLSNKSVFHFYQVLAYIQAWVWFVELRLHLRRSFDFSAVVTVDMACCGVWPACQNTCQIDSIPATRLFLHRHNF